MNIDHFHDCTDFYLIMLHCWYANEYNKFMMLWEFDSIIHPTEHLKFQQIYDPDDDAERNYPDQDEFGQYNLNYIPTYNTDLTTSFYNSPVKQDYIEPLGFRRVQRNGELTYTNILNITSNNNYQDLHWYLIKSVFFKKALHLISYLAGLGLSGWNMLYWVWTLRIISIISRNSLQILSTWHWRHKYDTNEPHSMATMHHIASMLHRSLKFI